MPIIFVDKWAGGFIRATGSTLDSKIIEMWHALQILIGITMPYTTVGPHWTISQDRSSAVWDDGLVSFLAAPSDLARVMETMAISP